MGAILLKIPQKSFSQEVTPTPSKDNQASSSSVIINYYLPYPGILPDHPLYKLKILRDRVSTAFIKDPKKKIEFYLLQTDKGILASAMLVDRKKIDLATHTAFKAEHNYTLLTYELGKFRKKPSADFFKKLKTASLKHQAVLASLAKRVAKNDAKKFQQVIDFSKINWKTVEEYQKRKITIKKIN